jgi:hypothetical protein
VVQILRSDADSHNPVNAANALVSEVRIIGSSIGDRGEVDTMPIGYPIVVDYFLVFPHLIFYFTKGIS